MRLPFVMLLMFLILDLEGPVRADDPIGKMGRPEIDLERGIMAMQMRHDLNLAKACFRGVLEHSGTAPRVAAEALWQMAEAYRRQGNDDAALLVLSKLTADYPNAQPFSGRAAELAVELSREVQHDYFSPNAADERLSVELAGILEAALQLGEIQEAAATAESLKLTCESMMFELAVAPPDEVKRERKDREKALANYREFRDFCSELIARLKKQPVTDLWAGLDRGMLREMQTEEDRDEADLNRERFRLKKAITKSLETRDAARIISNAEALTNWMQPLTEGPETLALTNAVRGELAAAKRVADLSRENKFADALREWKEAALAGLNSGVMASGLALEEPESIPRQMQPRVVAALMYLEAAVFGIMTEDKETDVADMIRQSKQRIIALKGEGQSPEFNARMDRTAARLAEGERLWKAGEISRAEDTLKQEMYYSE